MEQSVRPFRYVRKIFRENNKQSQDLSKFIFEKNDAFMLWIIGLASAFVAGMLAYIEKLLLYMDVFELKYVVGILILSIFFGILYRAIYINYFLYQDSIFRQIDVALTDVNTYETEFYLKGDETFEELIRLNSDFQDMSEFVRVYDLSNKEQKENIRISLIDAYKQNTNWAKTDMNNAMKTVNDAYQSTYGDNIIIKIQEHKRSFKLKHYATIIFILYVITTVSFLIALIKFSYHILNSVQ